MTKRCHECWNLTDYCTCHLDMERTVPPHPRVDPRHPAAYSYIYTNATNHRAYLSDVEWARAMAGPLDALSVLEGALLDEAERICREAATDQDGHGN